MIGVINYQTGNSRSVIYALTNLGIECRLVATPEDCEGVDRYILPGVGSAGVTMTSLAERGWIDLRAAAQESVTAIVRAGADIVLTYWAKEMAEWRK